MTTITYHIPAISCMHCVHTIKTELSELAGVIKVAPELESKNVTIQFEAPATEEKIKQLLAEINYPVAA